MEDFLIAVFSVICGASGYLIAKFWFQPIFEYREIKSKIIADLIFYSNAINPQGLNDKMKQRVSDRMVADRTHSARLTACFYSLPILYRKYLMKKSERPDIVSSYFIALSNTTEYDEANKLIDKIQEQLGINPKVV